MYLPNLFDDLPFSSADNRQESIFLSHTLDPMVKGKKIVPIEKSKISCGNTA